MEKVKTHYYRKVVLYGAGHPQLPAIFAVKGTDQQIAEFFDEHDTTHARFVKISRLEALARTGSNRTPDLESIPMYKN